MEIENNIFDQAWHAMYDELSGESERACAIVGCAYIDDLLGQILDTYVLENKDAYNDLLNSDNFGAPLGCFGSRIITAYGVGLIDKDQLDALRKLKRVRNKFAHDVETSFSDEEISRICIELKDIIGEVHYLSESPLPREIYQTSIAYFSARLREKLYLLSKFEVTGGFKSVLRLSAALGEALKSNE